MEHLLKMKHFVTSFDDIIELVYFKKYTNHANSNCQGAVKSKQFQLNTLLPIIKAALLV